MKKYLICVLFPFLLLCSQANAGVVVGSGTVAAACTTPTGDELSDSLGDGVVSCWSTGPSSCDNTFTATGAVSIADIPAGAAANTACEHGLYFDSTDAAAYIRRALDGTVANNVQTVIKFHLYITESTLGQYLNVALMSFTASTNMKDSNKFFSFHLYKGTSGTGTPTKMYVNSSTGALSFAVNTHYDITITLDAAAAAGGSTFQDGLGNTQTFTRGTSASVDYVFYGSADTGAHKGYIGFATVSTP